MTKNPPRPLHFRRFRGLSIQRILAGRKTAFVICSSVRSPGTAHSSSSSGFRRLVAGPDQLHGFGLGCLLICLGTVPARLSGQSRSSSVRESLQGRSSGFRPDRSAVRTVGVERRIQIDRVHRLRVHAPRDVEVVTRSDGLVLPVRYRHFTVGRIAQRRRGHNSPRALPNET